MADQAEEAQRHAGGGCTEPEPKIARLDVCGSPQPTECGADASFSDMSEMSLAQTTRKATLVDMSESISPAIRRRSRVVPPSTPRSNRFQSVSYFDSPPSTPSSSSTGSCPATPAEQAPATPQSEFHDAFNSLQVRVALDFSPEAMLSSADVKTSSSDMSPNTQSSRRHSAPPAAGPPPPSSSDVSPEPTGSLRGSFTEPPRLTRRGSLHETKVLYTAAPLQQPIASLKFDESFNFEDHFEYLSLLGEGSFSRVYRARCRADQREYAVKVSNRVFRTRKERKLLLREVENSRLLGDHKHIVRYYRAWQDKCYFYLQLELCSNGTLRHHLSTMDNKPSEVLLWQFLGQLASGLQHIHSHGLLHLDIKPENVFVTEDQTLKIGDLGLTIAGSEWEEQEGDSVYIAAELLRSQPGPPADIFSLGLMMYEVITNKPLPREGLGWHALREGHLDFEGTPYSDHLQGVVRDLSCPEPEERPTAMDLQEIAARCGGKLATDTPTNVDTIALQSFDGRCTMDGKRLGFGAPCLAWPRSSSLEAQL